MLLPPLPGFEPEDWRAIPPDRTPSMREESTILAWLDDARADHRDAWHRSASNPFCLHCEAGPDADDYALDAAEQLCQRRGLRFLRLGRRLPAFRPPPPTGSPFDLASLSEMLERPGEPPMRADGLIPSEASTLLVAQRKTGKTTWALNYARCLIDGGDFLGRFPVRPIDGSVAILNYEVSGHTLSRWAAEQSIDAGRLHIVNVRGRRNPLSHPEDRAALAQALVERQVEVVIVDTFGRAYTGTSQNDAGEVGSWLVGLDTFVRSEVGANELVLTAHSGWNGERTRGSSALEDWADVVVQLSRDPEDESQRFMKAFGRDVDVDEDRLNYDEHTRTLTLAGVGSRKQAKSTRKRSDLAVFVRRAAAQMPGASTQQIVDALRRMDDAPTFQDRDVSHAARLAVEQGFLRIVDEGPGKPKRHYPETPSNPVQTPSPDVPPTPSTPSIGGRGGGAGVQQGHPVHSIRSIK